MLLRIRDYIARERIVSNQQVARFFHLDLTALQPMLDKWLKRGIIEVCDGGKACGRCLVGCNKKTVQYYRYIDFY